MNKKSVSTSDLSRFNGQANGQARHVSELALNSIICIREYDRLSRSLSLKSTFVAIGDTSQLPSPHMTFDSPHGPSVGGSLTVTSSQQQLSASNLFGPRHRDTYIRNRLLTTHRAIERLTQSEFNLDQLARSITISDGQHPMSSGPTEIKKTKEIIIPDKLMSQSDNNAIQLSTSPSLDKTKYRNISRNLTIHDIEKERGKPLSKYDRNYMIFNWLHQLEESSTVAEDSQ